MGQPAFTSESFEALEELEQEIRARVFNLIEDKLRSENRDVVTSNDIRECYARAVQELTEGAVPTK
jgi:hypothetical protein